MGQMVWPGEKGDGAQSWGDRHSLQWLGEAPGRRGDGRQALARWRIGGGGQGSYCTRLGWGVQSESQGLCGECLPHLVSALLFCILE